jgi:hypothetical protein
MQKRSAETESGIPPDETRLHWRSFARPSLLGYPSCVMSSSTARQRDSQRPRARYVRAPRALHFPESAQVPESKRHLELRTLLYQIVKYSYASSSSIGCDQFVYFDASDPARCVAPDLFVRTGVPDTAFGSWKVWERGTPHLAVEIISQSDASWASWNEKLARYHALGVDELVRFDPSAPAGSQLRVWDRVDEDLVERVAEGDVAPCEVLGLWWVVCPAPGLEAALRLAQDREGTQMLPTESEAEAKARQAADAARQAAERRIAELEDELRRRG